MKRLNYLKPLRILGILFTMGAMVSCTEDDGDDPDMMEEEDPIASFQFVVDEVDFTKVTFSNFSTNATTYSWDFGDESAANVEENPVYSYAEAGTYTVVLTASNDAGTSATFSESVTITDPLAAQRALIGENGKVWQLVADNSTGVNPLEVGPNDRSQVWFAIADLCSRECIFDDTWTFNTDGTYTYENNGDYWAEGGVFGNGNEECFDASDAANFVNTDGADISGWDSGMHDFTFDASASTLTINGGFIGLTKAGSEADDLTEPAASVTYSVVKLVEVEGAADTLVLETKLVAADGYWAFTLVSYANAADEVVVEECPPVTVTLLDAINIDFESDPPSWSGFGGPNSDGSGVVQSNVSNPVSGGINTSAMVGQLDEPDGSQGWTGISTILSGKLDFSTKQDIKVKVYSPFAGAVIKLKLEDSADANNNKEIDLTTTAADTWEELTYTFATDDSGKWDVLVLFFDFKDAAKSGARTHYFDDITF